MGANPLASFMALAKNEYTFFIQLLYKIFQFVRLNKKIKEWFLIYLKRCEPLSICKLLKILIKAKI